MNIKNKLIETIAGKYIEDRVTERLKEETVPYTGREEDVGWRPMTERATRDLTDLDQLRMQEIAHWLYDRTPVGKRIVEMTKDFVIGEGLTFSAEASEVQKVLDEHWQDPTNAWDLKQSSKILELGLFGEQCYPVFVNDKNGHVRIGNLDPSLIWKVEANPDNIEDIEFIKTRSASGMGTERKPYRVIHIDDNPESETYGLLVGDCFFFAINKVSNALRGRSDLLPLADWIDAYERFLFNRAERSHLLNTILWDATLTGYTPEQIKAWLKEQTVPKAATMRAHNEKVSIKAETPNLESADATNEARLILNHLLGGAGFPPHWFAWGQGITRATALEMSTPVFKMLKSRQKYFKYMITLIFRFVIDQKINAGVLDKNVNKKFTINLPKLTEKDAVNLATALNTTTMSLSTAVENEWISDKTAAKVYAFMISQLGMDVAPETESEQVKEESETVDYDQSKLKKAMEKVNAAKRT